MLTEHKGEMIFVGFAMVLYLVMAAFDASQKFVYLAVLFGLFGLVIAWKLFESVDDEPAGSEKMTEIADAIHEGAMVFLSREYRILGYFVGAEFILLLILISAQFSTNLFEEFVLNDKISIPLNVKLEKRGSNWIS